MKYKINQGLIKNVDKGRISILDTDKSSIYELNETAAFIFESLIKGFNEERLINLLVKKYHINNIQLKKDVGVIINDFLKKKIILPSKSKKQKK